ncbi:ubiquitin thioesterase ZRANB1-like [Patiria miniata]|uniref:ubiquitinyl hydrolase 1 n=1 Tax=Patiria miniata TaxID=46514 RepID=A0A913Z579_PATMI|nr:ubiquitin thioesterase ZRANB1-like [Patiria miniata]
MTDDHKKWTCEYCTYNNWPSAIKCTLCQARQPVQYISAPTSPEAPRRELIPRATGTGTIPLILPGSDNRGPLSPAAKWSCRICTYMNWPQATKCALCYSPPGSSSPTLEYRGRGVPRAIRMPRSPEASQVGNNDRNRNLGQNVKKWACPACTYENWPRAKKCALCMCMRGKLSPESGVAAGSSLIEENLRNVEASCRGSPPMSPPRSPDATVELQQVSQPSSATRATPRTVPTHGTINLSEHDNRLKQIRKRLRKSDWLFLNACMGVIEGDARAVELYLTSGGSPTRQLTRDEVTLLNRPSAFDVGFTLVHLAIRFQREDLVAVLLTPDVTANVVKRPPSQVCPDLATGIRREIAKSLRQRKGDFLCFFVTDLLTFILPGEIEDFPLTVRNQLFDELLDRDVQKELEQESPIINWSVEVAASLGSRLYALWNRTAGDCLLDSVLQATWGVFDTDAALRHALGDSLNEGGMRFFTRWKEYESMQVESMHFTLDEDQWEQDWSLMLSLAGQPGAALEQIHIFALAHIMRRPIIVYGVKYIKSFRGENIGYARFQGVYLPLLWEPSFCWKSPITLGYTRGHFSALVPMETDSDDNQGAGANLNTDDETQTVYLPLTDFEGKLLPIHFITPLELGSEERLLNEWFDCCYTTGGVFVAQQVHHKRRPVLIGQMVEEWLQRYRRIAQQL